MKPVYLTLLILVTNCSSLKEKKVGSPTSYLNTATNAKIIFLNYKVTKDLNKTIEASLINKTITKGTLKSKTLNTSIEGFVCLQLNKNSLPIDSIKIQNPLTKLIEYSNLSDVMEKKIIELDTAEFTVRMQLKPNTKFISLKKTNNNSPILTIQL